MGVTTKKNIIPIIIGEIISPKRIPNLNQILFKGLSILELINPRIKKIKDVIRDHILISSLWIKGYKAIKKNTTKKIIPKLLLELIFISSIISSIQRFLRFHILFIYTSNSNWLFHCISSEWFTKFLV